MDYGKLAYLKAREAERKIRFLNGKLQKTEKKTLLFESRENTDLLHVYEYKFNANYGGKIIVSVEIEDMVGEGKLFLNGKLYGEHIPMGTGEDVYTVPLTVRAGVNAIKLEFIPQIMSGDLGVTITVEGYVDYIDDDYRVSTADLISSTAVALTGGGFSLIYEYVGGSLALKNKLGGVKEVSLVGDEMCFKALVRTKDDELKLIYFDSDYTISNQVSFDVGVSSCTAYYYTSGFRYFAIKRGVIYRYNEVGTRNAVGYLASKLYGEWGYAGIIAKDNHGKAKFISFVGVENMYKIKNGCAYHFEMINGRLTVWYSVGGKSYRQTLVNGEIESVLVCGEYDEKIKTYDGSFLVRNRGRLSVEGA